MKFNINVKVNEDGSYKTYGTVLYDEEKMNECGFEPNYVFTQLKEAGYDFKIDETNKEKVTIDGVSYTKIAFNYEGQELLKLNVNNKDKTTTLTLKSFNDIKFNDFNPNALCDSMNDIRLLKALDAEILLNIEMPGKITESNIGKTINKREIQIDLLDDEHVYIDSQPKETTIEFKNGSNEIKIISYCETFDYLIYVAIGIGALILGLIVVLIIINRKTKSKPKNKIQRA